MSHKRAKTVRRLVRTVLGMTPSGDQDDYYQQILHRNPSGDTLPRRQIVLAEGSYRAVVQKIKRVSKASHHTPMMGVAAWAVVHAVGQTKEQLREAA